MNDNLKTYSDLELIKLLREKGKKSGAAFKELYNRYSPNIHAYCFKIFRDDAIAEDIFQETFMRFYQNIRVQENTVNVHGYLITIARNLSLNHKKKTDRLLFTDKLDLNAADYSNQDKRELLNLIDMALELLEFEYQDAFILKEYNGLTYEEIAEISGITLSNAKSRVFRARNKIKQILKPYLIDLEKHFR